MSLRHFAASTHIWVFMVLFSALKTVSGQSVYVSNLGGAVSEFDPSSGITLNSIPLTGRPTGMALIQQGQFLYVAQMQANSVAVIDTNTKANLLTVPVGKSPIALASSPDSKTVYVANSASNTVSVVSTASNTVVRTIAVGSAPIALAMAPAGDRLFVANYVSGTISVIDTSSNTLTSTWPARVGIAATAVSPDGATLYTANRATNQVVMYNTASGSVAKSIGGFGYPDAIAVTPSGASLYVANGNFDVNGSAISVIDTASSSVLRTVPVPAGPTTISVSLDGSQLYVVSQRSKTVSVINTESNTVVQTVTTSSSPFAALGAPVKASAPPDLCHAAPTGLPELRENVPELPRSCIQPTYPERIATTVKVNTATGLQLALTNAQCGQRIQVEPGVIYQGKFVVPGLACPDDSPVLVENSSIDLKVTCTGSSTYPCNGSTAGKVLPVFPKWVVPADSLAGTSYVPTLESISSDPALVISDYAANWYFAGLEITLAPNAQFVYPIVGMGEGTTSVAALPRRITFDRMLVHPAPCLNDTMSNKCHYVARGIDLNAIYGTVMYSRIWGIVNAGQDAQAINVNNSPGPFLIAGNYLEATGENIMFNTECTITSGGTGAQGWVPGDLGIPTCPAPADFTVRLNRFKKQMAWKALPSGCDPKQYQCYTVKNHEDIKHGERGLHDSNIYDTTFAQGQAVSFILNCFYPGLYVCQDITVTNNLFMHAPTLIAIAGNGQPITSTTCGGDGQPPCTVQTGQRFLFRNNLAVDIDGIAYGGAGCDSATGIGCPTGIAFQIQNTNGVVIDHNTVINKPSLYQNGLNFSDAQPTTDLNFQATNNFLFGSPFNNGGSPGAAIAALPSPVFGGQVFVGDYWGHVNIWGVEYKPTYPPGIISLTADATPVAGQPGCQFNNYPISACWPLDWALVGFSDFYGGNSATNLAGLTLDPASPYRAAATDGLDIGANVPAVLDAIAPVQ